MNLSLDEIYDITIKSLINSPEDWTYSDHFHKFRRGVGIPYTIENRELGVSVWLANGFVASKITIMSRVEWKDGHPCFTREVELPSLGLRRKWKLHRLSMSLFKKPTKWEVPISTQTDRDMKLKELLKDETKSSL